MFLFFFGLSPPNTVMIWQGFQIFPLFFQWEILQPIFNSNLFVLLLIEVIFLNPLFVNGCPLAHWKFRRGYWRIQRDNLLLLGFQPSVASISHWVMVDNAPSGTAGFPSWDQYLIEELGWHVEFRQQREIDSATVGISQPIIFRSKILFLLLIAVIFLNPLLVDGCPLVQWKLRRGYWRSRGDDLLLVGFRSSVCPISHWVVVDNSPSVALHVEFRSSLSPKSHWIMVDNSPSVALLVRFWSPVAPISHWVSVDNFPSVTLLVGFRSPVAPISHWVMVHNFS